MDDNIKARNQLGGFILLQLVEIKKHYKKKKAVDGISFEVNEGEIFGLIGANGAGKSTTIAMVATMLKPDSGDILFEGASIIKKPSAIRRHLGYVPQEISLYTALTGMDNLLFWGNAYHVPKEKLPERIKEVCDMIGFDENILKQKVSTYSGGMKRRLNIGAALLHHPKLVVLDEPTAGIDIVARNQILNSVLKLKETGTTILYCGHYMEEVEKICDRICMLHNGKIIDIRNKEELLNNPNKNLEAIYLEAIGQA